MKKFIKWLLIAVGIFIVLICIISGLNTNGEPSPTITPSPTKTPIPTATLTSYDHRDLITYPDNYKGVRVYITGEVFNVVSNKQLQIWAGEASDAIFVISDKEFQQIYEGDIVEIYGYIDGKYCGKNTMGGKSCQPLIINAEIYKVKQQ